MMAYGKLASWECLLGLTTDAGAFEEFPSPNFKQSAITCSEMQEQYYGEWDGSHISRGNTGAEGSLQGLFTSAHPQALQAALNLLRECCTARIYLVLIKSQHSVLRTTFLCWSIHSSKRSLEKSSLHSSYGPLSMQHLINVNFKQRRMLVSLPLNRCRLSTSAGSRGEELPWFLSWVTPPAVVMAPQDISSQPQRGPQQGLGEN